MALTKLCPKCKQKKPLTEFYKDKSRDKGRGNYLRGYCKSCDQKDAAKWAKKNRTKCNKSNKRYEDTHPEQVRKYRNDWKRKSREKTNPEILYKTDRKAKLKSLHSISIEEYSILLLKQNGVCAICGKPETETQKGRLRQLCVDHCHETGKIRGLLCSKCNKGLGQFLDDANLLLKASCYLRANT